MTDILPWFRLYHEVLQDPKLLAIELQTQEPKAIILGTWTAMLCLAAQAGEQADTDDGGRRLIFGDTPVGVEFLAPLTGLATGRIGKLVDNFLAQNMLARDGKTLIVCNWSSRQFKSDSSTVRTRRYRERKAGDEEPKPKPKPAPKPRKKSTPKPAPPPTAEPDEGPIDILSGMPSWMKAHPDNGRDQPDEQMALATYFTELTGIERAVNLGTWSRDWVNPIEQILEIAGGDLEKAKQLVADAVATLEGKYTIASPNSLVKTIRNHVGDGNGAAAVWKEIQAEMERVGYTSKPTLSEEAEELVKLAGGWRHLCRQKTDDAERLVRKAWAESHK